MSNVLEHNFVYDLDTGRFFENHTQRVVLDFPIGYNNNFTIQLKKIGVNHELPAGSLIEISFDQKHPVSAAAPILRLDTLSFGWDADRERYTNTFDTTLPPLNNTLNIEAASLTIADSSGGSYNQLLHVNFRNANLPGQVKQNPCAPRVSSAVQAFVRSMMSWQNIQDKPPLSESASISLATLNGLFATLTPTQKTQFINNAGIPRVVRIEKAFPVGKNYVEFDETADLTPEGVGASNIIGGTTTKKSGTGKNIQFSHLDTSGANPRIYGSTDGSVVGANTATLILAEF